MPIINWIKKMLARSKTTNGVYAPLPEENQSIGTSVDRNAHIKEYLQYYLSLPKSPGFSVLLDGPWGIGKTFAIKKFLDSLNKETTPYIYVSLYGTASVDDIDDAILQSMYPVLKKKGVALGGRALKSIGKYFNVELDLKAKDFVRKSKAQVYVFDDLERCELPINTVMGYINVFVEHEGLKVIIIANEKEIEEPQYKRVREKLVGRTFEIQSSLEEALRGFGDSIKDKATRDFITSNSSTISEVFHQSEMNNLRVLHQTILDFERVFINLEERHQRNAEAMAALLALLFALTFEIKAGRISSSDMSNRRANILSSYISRKKEDYIPAPIVAVKERYPLAPIDSDLLSDHTLVNLIVKGIIDQQKLRDEIDQSSFFRDDQEPAWRTVWNWSERTEEEANEAIAEITRAFTAHEFVIPGEILHIFGIQLRLSKIGALPTTAPQVVANAKAYVDHLYEQGLLEPIERPKNSFDDDVESYGGLGYMEANSAEFKDLHQYLMERRRAAAADRLPFIARDLLKMMQDNPSLFLRRISMTNHEDNEYYDIPILASLDARNFVDTFLNLHPGKQRTAMLALKSRYRNGMLERYLEDERAWANEVRDQLLVASATMSPLSRERLQRLVAYGLDEVLGLAGDK